MAWNGIDKSGVASFGVVVLFVLFFLFTFQRRAPSLSGRAFIPFFRGERLFVESGWLACGRFLLDEYSLVLRCGSN